MARPPRLLIPGGIYHVTARGNERGLLYRDPVDNERFLDILAEVTRRQRWRVLAYCLMGNHYHLLIQTPEPNLAAGMRQLNGVYAQSFNRRHTRVGHLFEGRYDAKLVQEDGHLHLTVRYIVGNPVRAGLCRQPCGWLWSSHRATIGETTPPPFYDVDALLARYGPNADAARRRYREHTEQADTPEASWHPLIVGDDAFVADALARVRPAAGIPRRYLRAPRPDLATLLSTIAGQAGIATAHEHGYSLREIARHLGVNVSTVSRRLRRDGLRTAGATLQT